MKTREAIVHPITGNVLWGMGEHITLNAMAGIYSIHGVEVFNVTTAHGAPIEITFKRGY